MQGLECETALVCLQAGVKHVMLTMGSQGAAVCSLDTSKTGMVTHHLAASPARIVNTNGAGDCLVAGSLACLGQGQRPVDALAFGMVSWHSFYTLSAIKVVNCWYSGTCISKSKLANAGCMPPSFGAVEPWASICVVWAQAVAKEGLEQEGNVPDTLSHQALSAASQKSLRKCSTMHFRHGSELAIAKL